MLTLIYPGLRAINFTFSHNAKHFLFTGKLWVMRKFRLTIIRKGFSYKNKILDNFFSAEDVKSYWIGSSAFLASEFCIFD